MVNFEEIIDTERILLRPMRTEDVDGMFALTSSSDMWIYFTSDLSNRNELEKWIKDGIDDKSRLALTVIHKESEEIIGSTSIGNISTKDKRAEIGWTWLGKKFQGEGFNKQIKNTLLEYLFEKCNFERIEFKTDVLNIPARKLELRRKDF